MLSVLAFQKSLLLTLLCLVTLTGCGAGGGESSFIESGYVDGDVIPTTDLTLNSVNRLNDSNYTLEGICIEESELDITIDGTTRSITCSDGTFSEVYDLSLLANGDVEVTIEASLGTQNYSGSYTLLKDSISAPTSLSINAGA